ncbi:MAG: hypothetical protein PUD07_04440 [bacterium]|nr:hypothetical protein [bacterium]
MEDLFLKEYYYNSLLNSHYVNKNNMIVDIATMQKIYVEKENIVMVKDNEKITIINLITNEINYYIFTDKNNIFNHIYTKFDNNELAITYSLIKHAGNDFIIHSQGALMEINDINVKLDDKLIDNDLLTTIINIQKSGLACIINICISDDLISNNESIFTDLEESKNKMLNKINNDLSKKLEKR